MYLNTKKEVSSEATSNTLKLGLAAKFIVATKNATRNLVLDIETANALANAEFQRKVEARQALVRDL